MSQKDITEPQHQEILQIKVDFRENFEGRLGKIFQDEDFEVCTKLGQ